MGTCCLGQSSRERSVVKRPMLLDERLSLTPSRSQRQVALQSSTPHRSMAMGIVADLLHYSADERNAAVSLLAISFDTGDPCLATSLNRGFRFAPQAPPVLLGDLDLCASEGTLWKSTRVPMGYS